MLLNSCVLTPVSRDQSTSPTAIKPALNPALQYQLQRLLEAAYLALDEKRLTTPSGNNAHNYFLQILDFNPHNRLAKQGIEDIVEQYLQWAIKTADQQDLNKARYYLNKARAVNPAHPDIIRIENKLLKQSNTASKVYPLSKDALTSRSETLVNQLQNIAQLIEQFEASVVISAPSDAKGRWIYQQLNTATDSRLRATFKKAATANVRIIYP
ncbi:MAG: hypothetical protein KUG79_13505 [Pseudomonadales bacterium]|nr:hypothetical protein [Pseudomonadales bacterium]